MTQRKRELELDVEATRQNHKAAKQASKEADNAVLMAKSRAIAASDADVNAYANYKKAKSALNRYLNS
jgi:hypothetical protein